MHESGVVQVSADCETLVLLAVHGKDLLRDADLERHVLLLIRKLLSPLTLEKLLSHDRDLRTMPKPRRMSSFV